MTETNRCRRCGGTESTTPKADDVLERVAALWAVVNERKRWRALSALCDMCAKAGPEA